MGRTRRGVGASEIVASAITPKRPAPPSAAPNSHPACVREHDTLDAFYGAGVAVPARTWVLSTKATRSVFDADFQPGDALLFGKETRGLPEDVLGRFAGQGLRMPMVAGERSLNLATAVCAVVYEGVRQCLARGQAQWRDGELFLPS